MLDQVECNDYSWLVNTLLYAVSYVFCACQRHSWSAAGLNLQGELAVEAEVAST